MYRWGLSGEWPIGSSQHIHDTHIPGLIFYEIVSRDNGVTNFTPSKNKNLVAKKNNRSFFKDEQLNILTVQRRFLLSLFEYSNAEPQDIQTH